jgi:hypothetical protein
MRNALQPAPPDGDGADQRNYLRKNAGQAHVIPLFDCGRRSRLRTTSQFGSAQQDCSASMPHVPAKAATENGKLRQNWIAHVRE